MKCPVCGLRMAEWNQFEVNGETNCGMCLGWYALMVDKKH